MCEMRRADGIRRKFIILRLMLTSQEKRAGYLKKKNIFKMFGDRCKYACNTIPAEPYLVKIHNNVRIAAGVSLCTHDVIDGIIKNCEEYRDEAKHLTFHMGTIEILDNCMIGANSIILPNVTIGPNSIVAAGSVVTRSVQEGTIVGGNPAKVIGKFEDYAKKRIEAPIMASNKDSFDRIIQDYWKERL